MGLVRLCQLTPVPERWDAPARYPIKAGPRRSSARPTHATYDPPLALALQYPRSGLIDERTITARSLVDVQLPKRTCICFNQVASRSTLFIIPVQRRAANLGELQHMNI